MVRLEQVGRYARNTFAIGLGLTSTALAEEYIVSGTIRSLERSTGTPQANVRVDVDSSSYITPTAPDGSFTVKVPAGNHSIRFSKEGFKGYCKKSVNVTANTNLNISMPSNNYESPSRTAPLTIAENNELNVNDEEYQNGLTWRDVTQGNPIPVYIANASAREKDTLSFINAIADIENKQGRTIYTLSNDPEVGNTKRGVRVNFNADHTVTIPLAIEDNTPYLYMVEVNLRTNNDVIIKKEMFGRVFQKGDVFSRFSYMNGTGTDINDVDHMLNILFFNHWAAIGRGEQQATLYEMEEKPVFTTPNTSTISSPANNSTNVPLDQIVQWSNSFGTDTYELQIANDSGFTSIVLDSAVTKINAKTNLQADNQYYARVRAKNGVGTSGWSSPIKFETIHANRPPIIVQYIDDITMNEEESKEIPVKNNVEDPDGDIITKTVQGSNELNLRIEYDTLKIRGQIGYFGNSNVIVTYNDGHGGTAKDTFQVNTIHVNHAPTPSTAIQPINADTANYNNHKLIFQCKKSTDADVGDTVKYITHLIGPGLDSTITTRDTTFSLDENIFQKGKHYIGILKTTDGKDTIDATNQFDWNTTTTGVEDKVGNVPKEYTLSQNFPNPFNPSTSIQYGLPARSTVRLVIYNVLGQVVKELINIEQPAGIQAIVWNSNVTSGLYFYRLEATSLDNPSKRFVETKKMLLLR